MTGDQLTYRAVTLSFMLICSLVGLVSSMFEFRQDPVHDDAETRGQSAFDHYDPDPELKLAR